MDKSAFIEHCKNKKLPGGDPILISLFYIYHKQWIDAHDIIQNQNNSIAKWIHGMLHRMEGDDWNARYWYSKSGHNKRNQTIEQEWNTIVDHYLQIINNSS